MRLVLQRVRRAAVRVDGDVVGQIETGLLVLVGVGRGDDESAADWLAEKTVGLRIFADEEGKMNRSVVDAGGSVLAVSQFTLLGDCRKGRRPAMTAAAPPKIARSIYGRYVAAIADRGVPVAEGVFGADMQVSLVNDGPVTFVLDR